MCFPADEQQLIQLLVCLIKNNAQKDLKKHAYLFLFYQIKLKQTNWISGLFSFSGNLNHIHLYFSNIFIYNLPNTCFFIIICGKNLLFFWFIYHNQWIKKSYYPSLSLLFSQKNKPTLFLFQNMSETIFTWDISICYSVIKH